MSFSACLPVILASEGGFADDPRDPGGATNLGVTQATLSHWLGRPAGLDEVKALTPQAVAPLYQAWYWHAAGCHLCPDGVDLMVFDMAVNQGPRHAVEALQAALGADVDGLVGPSTRAALQACDARAVIARIRDDREARYRASANFPVFGKGWLARLARTCAIALEMAPAERGGRQR